MKTRNAKNDENNFLKSIAAKQACETSTAAEFLAFDPDFSISARLARYRNARLPAKILRLPEGRRPFRIRDELPRRFSRSRLPVLAPNGLPARSAIWSLSGGKQTSGRHPISVAIDPQPTSAVG